MKILNKFFYNTWNIGFIENSTIGILNSIDSNIKVHWLKHPYKDRFFADPFILSVKDDFILVLVEEFPYYNKKGVISLLKVDRKTYALIEKKEVLKQPFHMSYPFIMRKDSGEIWVAPESSQSGNLYYYSINPDSMMLENQKLLVPEPLLDSTIVEYNDMWWLFCTKRGSASNKDLHIFYSKKPEGPWTAHTANPVVKSAATARPAGYLLKDGSTLYRLVQKCDKRYGEAVNVTRVDVLSTTEFKETFIKELRLQNDIYSNGFHTLNELDGLVVVDGNRKRFAPLRKIVYEFRNKFNTK